MGVSVILDLRINNSGRVAPRFYQVAVRTTLEAVYIAAHFLEPFIPKAMELVFKNLNTPRTHLRKLNANFMNLKVTYVLFACVTTHNLLSTFGLWVPCGHVD